MRRFFVLSVLFVSLCFNSCDERPKLGILDKKQTEEFYNVICKDYEYLLFETRIGLEYDDYIINPLNDAINEYAQELQKKQSAWENRELGKFVTALFGGQSSDYKAQDQSKIIAKFKMNCTEYKKDYVGLKDEIMNAIKEKGVKWTSMVIDSIMQLNTREEYFDALENTEYANYEPYKTLLAQCVDNGILPDSLEANFIKDNRINYDYLVRWDVKNKTVGGLDGTHLVPLISLIKYLADDVRNYTIDYIVKIQKDPETYEIGLSNEDALKVRFSTKDIPCTWDLTEYTTTYKGYGLKD